MPASAPATAPPPSSEPDVADVVPAPVFVDATGRRRRAIRTTAFAFIALVGAYGVAVALSFLGGPVPPNALLPIPGPPSAASGSNSTGKPDASTPHTVAAHAGSGTPTGTAPVSGLTNSPGSSQAASPSPSPSGDRRVPPGKVGKSASPGPSSGHGH